MFIIYESNKVLYKNTFFTSTKRELASRLEAKVSFIYP